MVELLLLLKAHNKTAPEPHSGKKDDWKSQNKEENITEVYEQQTRSLEWNPSSHKFNFN